MVELGLYPLTVAEQAKALAKSKLQGEEVEAEKAKDDKQEEQEQETDAEARKRLEQRVKELERSETQLRKRLSRMGHSATE